LAKTKNPSDLYTSRAIFTPTESAANTLTFEKLETGLSIYDKIGWVIARVEARLSAATLALFNGTGDSLSLGITMSNSIISIGDDNPAVYSNIALVRLDFGTAANAEIGQRTYIKDYSTLPGGGLLVLPNPLYAGIQGVGLTGAASANISLFYQAVELSDADYFNLIQARQLLIST